MKIVHENSPGHLKYMIHAVRVVCCRIACIPFSGVLFQQRKPLNDESGADGAHSGENEEVTENVIDHGFLFNHHCSSRVRDLSEMRWNNQTTTGETTFLRFLYL